MTDPFNCEHAMFLSLQDGSRRFDLRLWDVADERLYRLAWFNVPATAQARVPEVETVSFADKETGELLTFAFRGLTFTPWAKGWVFILLGDRIPEGS